MQLMLLSVCQEALEAKVKCVHFACLGLTLDKVG